MSGLTLEQQILIVKLTSPAYETCLNATEILKDLTQAAALITKQAEEIAHWQNEYGIALDITEAFFEENSTLNSKLEEAKRLLGAAWVHVPDKPKAPKLNEEISAFLSQHGEE